MRCREFSKSPINRRHTLIYRGWWDKQSWHPISDKILSFQRDKKWRARADESPSKRSKTEPTLSLASCRHTDLMLFNEGLFFLRDIMRFAVSYFFALSPRHHLHKTVCLLCARRGNVRGYVCSLWYSDKNTQIIIFWVHSQKRRRIYEERRFCEWSAIWELRDCL